MEEKWYNRTGLVALLCFLVFPVGLYGLWRSKKINILTKAFVSTLFIIAAIGAFVGNPPETSTTSTAKTELSKKDMVNAQFNPFTNEHIKLKELIKNNMNDNDSYEHVETRWSVDSDSSIYVSTRFRGKNAFGAVVLESVAARYSFKGDLIELISQ